MIAEKHKLFFSFFPFFPLCFSSFLSFYFLSDCLPCAGHSMGGGMAAVAAGSHPSAVSTAFLMDPVDWNLESNRVDSQYLTRCVSCHICADSAALMIRTTMATHLHYMSLLCWLCISHHHEMYVHSHILYSFLCLSACV